MAHIRATMDPNGDNWAVTWWAYNDEGEKGMLSDPDAPLGTDWGSDSPAVLLHRLAGALHGLATDWVATEGDQWPASGRLYVEGDIAVRGTDTTDQLSIPWNTV